MKERKLHACTCLVSQSLSTLHLGESRQLEIHSHDLHYADNVLIEIGISYALEDFFRMVVCDVTNLHSADLFQFLNTKTVYIISLADSSCLSLQVFLSSTRQWGSIPNPLHVGSMCSEHLWNMNWLRKNQVLTKWSRGFHHLIMQSTISGTVSLVSRIQFNSTQFSSTQEEDSILDAADLVCCITPGLSTWKPH